MQKYCLFILIFLSIISVGGCKPSPRMGGERQQKTAEASENALSSQIIEKIQNVYREKSGYTIKVIKVHESLWLSEKLCHAELIIEREGKRYLTLVRIEEIDGIPVIETCHFLDKEIK